METFKPEKIVTTIRSSCNGMSNRVIHEGKTVETFLYIKMYKPEFDKVIYFHLFCSYKQLIG